MKTIHPAALTAVSLIFILAATLLHDTLIIGSWTVLGAIVLLTGRILPLRRWSIATGTAMLMGLGLGINHGLFPAEGANPYLAWAYVLRPLCLTQWSLTLSTCDPILWAESLHRFWRLPITWTYGAQAGLRFMPLLEQDYRMARNWQCMHPRPHKNFVQKRSGSILTMLVVSLRYGARSALAMEARNLTTVRSWSKPLRWRTRDSLYLVCCTVLGLLIAMGCRKATGTIVFWSGGF